MDICRWQLALQELPTTDESGHAWHGRQHDSWGQAEAIHALTSLQDDSSLAPMSH